MFGRTFHVKKSQFFQFMEEKKYHFFIFLFFCNHPDFYLPTWGKFAPPYASPDLAQNLSSD
jgi:hypothetical protein